MNAITDTRPTSCLAIDIIGSTEATKDLTHQELQAFYEALHDDLTTHLKRLSLDTVVVNFSGDGWFIFSQNQEDYVPLYLLALITMRSLPERLHGIGGVRAAIGFGQDKITKVNDTLTALGDSARFATRLMQLCDGSELLSMDVFIYLAGKRDVVFKQIDVEKRISELKKVGKSPKWEEDVTVCRIIGPKETEESARIPALHYFASIMGNHKLAEEVSEDIIATFRVADRSGKLKDVKQGRQMIAALDDLNRAHDLILSHEVLKTDRRSWHLLLERQHSLAAGIAILREMSDMGVVPSTATGNRLINLCTTYSKGREILDEMLKAGLTPDTFTYSTLMNLAPGYAEAREVLDEMERKGVEANTVTYSTLMNLAPGYAEARKVLDEMERKGVEANTVTYSTLMNLAPGYAEARKVLDEMEKKGVEANTVTFNTLMNLAPGYAEARKVLDEMGKKEVEANTVTFTTLGSKVSCSDDLSPIVSEALLKLRSRDLTPLFNSMIGSLRRGKCNDKAIVVSQSMPFLPASQKLFREIPEQVLGFLESDEGLSYDDPRHRLALAGFFEAIEQYDLSRLYLEEVLDMSQDEALSSFVEVRLSRPPYV